MFHQKEIEDPLNLRFTELYKRFSALSAISLVQGMTLQSCRDTYSSFIGEQVTDQSIRESCETYLDLEGDSSCGDDSNRCCKLFTGETHIFSTTNYKELGFSHLTLHYHLAEMKLEMDELHAKQSIYQTEKESFLATPLSAMEDEEKYLALQHQKNKMIADLSDKEKEKLLTLVRAKMQSLTSIPAKGDDDEFESLLHIHDSIQTSMHAEKKLDVIAANPVSLREDIKSEYDTLIGLLAFQEQNISADIRKIEKLSKRSRTDYDVTHRHLLDRIEQYPCLIRIEFARTTAAHELLGSHSLTLYLTSPNQFYIYQSDFGKFSLAEWMASEEKSKLEAKGLLNFCKLLGETESEDLDTRIHASKTLRKGYEYSEVQRVFIKSIPVDKSIGLRNIEELDAAATLEYKSIMDTLEDFKKEHHLPEQSDFPLLWITFLRVEYCLDCIKNAETLELGADRIRELEDLVSQSLQTMHRLELLA